MVDTARGFTLVRNLDATPEAIFTAWTDADAAAEWWHPRQTTTPRESVQIDARVGGEYRYTMVNDLSGEGVDTGGVYSEVVAPTKLVFTWGVPGERSDDTPVVTIAIEPEGELTLMRFDLRGVDGFSGDSSYYDGWEQALDSLTEYLARTA